MMAYQAEDLMEVPVSLHALRHRGRVDFLQEIACTSASSAEMPHYLHIIIYSGEESNSYQGEDILPMLGYQSLCSEEPSKWPS